MTTTTKKSVEVPVVKDSGDVATKPASLWSTFKSEVTNGTFFPIIGVPDEFEISPDNLDKGNQQQQQQQQQAYDTIMDDYMIQEAFFPSNKKTLICKLLLRGWAISTFTMAIADSQYPWFEMAFLTNWSLLVTIIYMSLSFLASIAAACSLSWASTSSPTTLSSSSSSIPKLRTFFVRGMTIFFPIAAVQELVVMLFWISPQAGKAHPYVIIMGHGPLIIPVLLDGLLLNSIPVRARLIVFVWVLQSCYGIWSGFYSAFDLMNPNNMMMNMDEAIYRGFLNWRLYPGKTLIFCFSFLFVLTPVVFGLVWTLSQYASRFQQSRASNMAWADSTKHPMSMHFESGYYNDDDVESTSNSVTQWQEDDDEENTSLASSDDQDVDVLEGDMPGVLTRMPSLMYRESSMSVYSVFSV